MNPLPEIKKCCGKYPRFKDVSLFDDDKDLVLVCRKCMRRVGPYKHMRTLIKRWNAEQEVEV